MKTKSLLVSVVVSGLAALVAPIALEQAAGLSSAQYFAPVAATVFVLVLLSNLIVVNLGAGGAQPKPRTRPAGESQPVEQDSADDDRESGTVKWFNVTKGFGFITRDEGDDIFVHFRSIRGTGHRSLIEGQRVKFSVVESDKGLQAEDVSIVR